MAEWFPPTVAPTDEMPVIAEYREWGLPDGKKRTQTVWYYGGEWRCYPETSGHAHVDKWRFKTTRRAHNTSEHPNGERHG